MSSILRDSASHDARLGYNGALHEAGLRWQNLGNGYRVFSPVLMRFQGADSLSPFGDGGISSYAYAQCDPVNRMDPSGHFAQFIALGAFGLGAASGLAAGMFHLLGDERARNIFAAVALGSTVVAAFAGTGYMIPRHLAPKVPGQQPASSGRRLPMGGMRLFRAKDGTHVLQMHGEPGAGYLGGRRVGPGDVTQRVIEAAGTTPVKRLQMQVCHGANRGAGGTPPLAQGVADRLGVPVMAFEGKVKNVGERLTYKIGSERYFLPGGPVLNRSRNGGQNPWRLDRAAFPRYVRELRRGNAR